MKNLPAKEYFRPDEVAAIMSTSKRTIYRKIRAGELIGEQRKTPGPLWVPRASLIEFMTSQTGGSHGIRHHG